MYSNGYLLSWWAGICLKSRTIFQLCIGFTQIYTYIYAFIDTLHTYVWMCCRTIRCLINDDNRTRTEHWTQLKSPHWLCWICAHVILTCIFTCEDSQWLWRCTAVAITLWHSHWFGSSETGIKWRCTKNSPHNDVSKRIHVKNPLFKHRSNASKHCRVHTRTTYMNYTHV